ncbi:MAG: PspA/IM30 family protein [Bacteroidetes bacterium]|nr:PspA/IM30 family protein [Bacteroidota bacterium]
MADFQPKSFWKKPEGFTGILFLLAIGLGSFYLFNQFLPLLIELAENTLYLAGMLAALAGIIFVALDSKNRNLIWYMYQSAMRWITGIFVKIDPISILKSYIDSLELQLRNLSKQIGNLRGQMRKLKGIMDGNTTDIQKNMLLAEQANKQNDEKNRTLLARKAARLQDANAKYEVLYKKMEVLYRILTKMYENAEIVLEDTKDQVSLKEQEFQAIKAGHSAIRSAMSVISGDPDQRAIFNQALETLADEVSQKVGEMERFMDTSRNLMDSIDLQNGVFEEDGLRLLERWENDNPLLLQTDLSKKQDAPLSLQEKPREAQKEGNDYSQLFD